MAKSNLRLKDKTFNFGLAAGFSDSEGSEPTEKQLDFYPAADDRDQGQVSDNEEEEMQLAPKPRVNPFASRKTNPEIAPSKLAS